MDVRNLVADLANGRDAAQTTNGEDDESRRRLMNLSNSSDNSALHYTDRNVSHRDGDHFYESDHGHMYSDGLAGDCDENVTSFYNTKQDHSTDIAQSKTALVMTELKDTSLNVNPNVVTNNNDNRNINVNANNHNNNNINNINKTMSISCNRAMDADDTLSNQSEKRKQIIVKIVTVFSVLFFVICFAMIAFTLRMSERIDAEVREKYKLSANEGWSDGYQFNNSTRKIHPMLISQSDDMSNGIFGNNKLIAKPGPPTSGLVAALSKTGKREAKMATSK